MSVAGPQHEHTWSPRVREVRAGAVEVSRAAHRPTTGVVPARSGSAADDGGPLWTELQTQTLIYSQAALGLHDADIARYVGRSPQAVARRAAGLVRAGRLRPRAHEGGIAGRPRPTWEELRPAIRGLYEEKVPSATIELMLGMTPRELTTQLRRLFHEGLPPRR
jgi:hypothetical protein